MAKVNILKPTKELKTSREVIEFTTAQKVKTGVLPYKGGYGVLVEGQVKEIFVGPKALEEAKKRASSL